MDATNRFRCFAQFMRDWPPTGVSKPDLIAAVNAVDDWADANATEYNQALPQPYRGVATASEKALLLAYICMRRAGVLKAEED